MSKKIYIDLDDDEKEEKDKVDQIDEFFSSDFLKTPLGQIIKKQEDEQAAPILKMGEEEKSSVFEEYYSSPFLPSYPVGVPPEVATSVTSKDIPKKMTSIADIREKIKEMLKKEKP